MARVTLQLKLKTNDLINGRYTVLKKLGEGGCGSVYRCKPLKAVKGSESEVAVKMLENASDLARFKREKKVLGSIRHQHVVKLLDHGQHERHPYLVLEYMEGGSVRDLMDKEGRLSPEDAAWVLVQAVRGLRASRTVHRDMKPENLLVGRGIAKNGTLKLTVDDIKKGSVIKVADFGLAKAHDPNTLKLTNTGQVMGTPVYMSPEQCRNTRTVTPKSDIYSLGIIYFEMIVGKPPFEANNAYDIMAMHCNDAPKYPSRLDPRVKAVLEQCLAKTPKDRYGSLYALERDLATIAGLGEPEPDRSSWAWIIILIGLLVLGALAFVLRDELMPLVSQWFEKLRR
ncbi:MAG: serine/threonine protein kinase [Planctomycetes bacterium]|nr:serine/threonine protein kinase [Planctomycetota bacterium]